MDGRALGPAAAVPAVRSSELLAFPPGARVLIVNADDFGMYHAVNAAGVESVEEGIASSCSLMVPCPWALHAMHLLRQKPQAPFGIQPDRGAGRGVWPGRSGLAGSRTPAAATAGLPVTDHEFLDSFSLDIDGKPARYAELLRELPAGLSEWAVHPEPGAPRRPAVSHGRQGPAKDSGRMHRASLPHRLSLSVIY